jgi:serine/threonine protein kinase
MLELGEKFAAGGSGQIFKAKFSNMDVAVKQLYSAMLDPSNLQEFKNETYLLSTLRHPSVVNFYGISVDGVTGDVYIVTELACCSVNAPLYNAKEGE